MVQKRRNSFSVPSLPPLGRLPAARKATSDRAPSLPPSHFLGNVNLDRCSVLSLPDPPSPPKRNPRRQSSPLILPLRDVTNETEAPLPALSGKRARKSLCHVPSPALEDGDEKEKQASSLKKEAESKSLSESKEEPVNTSETSIYFLDDDDDDDVVVSASKRRKRRESMILPSDAALLDEEDSSKGVLEEDAQQPETTLSEPKDNKVISTRRRHIKRQSMLLPSDAIPLKDAEANDFFESLQNYRSNESQTVDGVPVAKTNEQNDETSSLGSRSKRRQSMNLQSNVASVRNTDSNRYIGHLQVLEPTKDLRVDHVDEEKFAAKNDDDDACTSTRKRPAKRQSILLPSDVTLAGDDEKAAYYGNLKILETKAKMEPSHNFASTRTRPPRRNSIVCPNSRPPVQENTSSTSDERIIGSADSKDSPSGTSKMNVIRRLVREYCSLSPADRHTSSQAEAIERLTGYGLIPPAKRHRTEEANLVEPGSSKDEELKRRASRSTSKQEILAKLGDLVELMDKRKAEDAKSMEQLTSITVQRARSGKFRYRDIATNKRVNPDVYKETYLAALDQCKPEIQQRIRDWIASVDSESSIDASTSEESDESVVEASTPEESESDDESKSAIHDQCVKVARLVERAQAPVDEMVQATDPAVVVLPEANDEFSFTEPGSMSSVQPDSDRRTSEVSTYSRGSDMELCDSIDEVDSSVVCDAEPEEGNEVSEGSVHDQCAMVASGLETAQAPPEETDQANDSKTSLLPKDHDEPSTPLPLNFDSTANVSNDDMDVCDDMDESLMSLGEVSNVHQGSPQNDQRKDQASAELEVPPLPSRDEESNDPEIAAAERRLWASIDSALETYSREVMAISAARMNLQN